MLMKEERSIIVRLLAATNAGTWFRCLCTYTCKSLQSHPLACVGLGLTLVLATVAIAMLAQRSLAAAAPDQLAVAIKLYQQGEVSLAQAMFAAIQPNDPACGVAQAYDALCRYALCRAARTNDYRWFLNALASPAVQQAVLPPELREDLAFKEIDALYLSGQFQEDQALRKIAAFQTAYPASARLSVMAEYDLAARLERGMQWIYKAALVWPGDYKNFQERWTNGLPHLEQFMSRAQAFQTNDYTSLRDRSLAEDMQVTLAVLGGQPAALAEITVRDAERRERYGLVRVGMHQKLNPEAWGENLQMLADFQAELQTFPASPRRLRVEYDLARLAFRAGERLCQENAGALPSEAEMVAAKRAGASRYFEPVRALARRVVVDEAAGVGPAELAWVRQMWFAAYYYEQDYAGLRAAAEAEAKHSKPGDLDWLRAKVFSGIALYRQTPPQRDAAVAAFEEVLAQGFQSENEHDVMILDAGGWRMQLALMAGDQARVRQLFDWVKQSQCEAKAKAKFFQDRRDHAALVAWPGR